MKINRLILLLIVCSFNSCKEETECCVFPEQEKVTLNFTYNWDGVPVTSLDFNQKKFINANNDTLSIERLRYLVSNISLINAKNYFLIAVTDNAATSSMLLDINPGVQHLKFRFGFSDEDNTDGVYPDLNSANFNVPEMLGGGYHYMQFDGKFITDTQTEESFNYHAIRAIDSSNPDNINFVDTSFEVDLGNINTTNTTKIEIKMNLAAWFKNPITWNLNELNTVLMPNFIAQKQMNLNGKSVFSLGEITN